ncbi:MAG TPA: NTP transferase domain-containing protein [Mycobacteriales bacterium]|nr:NTP transferase domain-containing protein [Mycobacteriales bacterium]
MTGAVVLAAGPGTRLKDLGARMPKTMIPVAGRPYLEHLVGRLLGARLCPVAVAVHHHADMIRAHFNGHPYEQNLLFVHTGQRGTGADLMSCLDVLPTPTFIVWNGDTVVDLDLPDLFRCGEQATGSAVIALTRRGGVPNQGAWYVDAGGTVLATREAVPAHPEPSSYVWRGSSTGVLLLRRSLLAAYHPDGAPDLFTTILPALIARRRLKAFDNGTRYFLDFGTSQALAQLDHTRVAGWA